MQAGTAKQYNYAKAKTLTSTFANNSEWRLPNIAELNTIIERENSNPSINIRVFTNVPLDNFWTSSPSSYNYSFSTSLVWVVNFYYGADKLANKYNYYAVRLVRGEQWTWGSLVTPTSNFTDNQDGTVTHNTTGLTWMRCAMGQIWTGSTCTGPTKMYNYAKAKALTLTFADQSDWRLPNQMNC